MGLTSAKINNTEVMEDNANPASIAQVYIFRHEECLGWDCFYKNTVSIGSGDNADIQLAEEQIDDIHAWITISNGKISVTPETSAHPIQVNGKNVDTCILGPFDFITIGSHSIKVKLPKISQSLVRDMEDAEALKTPHELKTVESGPSLLGESSENRPAESGRIEPVDETDRCSESDQTYIPNFLLVKNENENALHTEAEVIDEKKTDTGWQITLSEGSEAIDHSPMLVVRQDNASRSDDRVDTEAFAGVEKDENIPADQDMGFIEEEKEDGPIAWVEDEAKGFIDESVAETGYHENNEDVKDEFDTVLSDFESMLTENSAGNAAGQEPEDDDQPVFENPEPGPTDKLNVEASQPVTESTADEKHFSPTENVIKRDEPQGTLPINEITSFLDEKITQQADDEVSDGPEVYRIVFQGECFDDCDPKAVKKALSGILKIKNKKLDRLFSGQRVIVKKNIDHKAAVHFQNIFKSSGALCRIEKMDNAAVEDKRPEEKIEPVVKAYAQTLIITPAEEIDEIPDEKIEQQSFKESEKQEPELFSREPVEVYWEDAEEDEDYDDNPTPFLKEVLAENQTDENLLSEKHTTIEIIKLRDNDIVDVRFLNPSEKYFIYNQQGRFCLAEYKNGQQCRVYFNEHLTGHVQDDRSNATEIAQYQVPENIHKKSKGIYCLSLDHDEQVSLSDEDYKYLVRVSKRAESPDVPDPEKAKNPFYKNLLRSSGFHLLVLFIFGLAGLFPDMPEPKGPESHFVKIDVSQLKKETPPPVVKPKPKEKPPEVRPTTSTQLAKASKPKKKTRSKKRTGRVSSSPNAGGGSGKDGNVLNRNVNETGILGMIGDSIGFTPKEALATVTNLDVVSSPVSGGKTMKVGGIAGKLSTDEISIPTGGVVRSGGTSQVLRSVGVAGEGTVAALKKGKTGQKDVMGMVSVDLDKSVRVEGGMSRDAVKKVIDQHLDEISFCYENALMDSPALMGNIVFEWKILLSGRVGEVRIKSSSIRSKEIHSCIKAAIKTWQFPQPTNAEVVVSYPFVFNIVGF